MICDLVLEISAKRHNLQSSICNSLRRLAKNPNLLNLQSAIVNLQSRGRGPDRGCSSERDSEIKSKRDSNQYSDTDSNRDSNRYSFLESITALFLLSRDQPRRPQLVTAVRFGLRSSVFIPPSPASNYPPPRQTVRPAARPSGLGLGIWSLGFEISRASRALELAVFRAVRASALRLRYWFSVSPTDLTMSL